MTLGGLAANNAQAMDLSLTAWQLWLLAGLAAGALEIKLSGFVMLWLAIGAFASALVAGLGFSAQLQLGVFIAISVILFAASRTIFQRAFMRNAPEYKIGIEAMLDSEAVVVDLLPARGQGTVRIHGELWSARSIDGPIGPGEVVRVESVEGLKLRVRRLPPASMVVTTRGENTP